MAKGPMPAATRRKLKGERQRQRTMMNKRIRAEANKPVTVTRLDPLEVKRMIARSVAEKNARRRGTLVS